MQRRRMTRILRSNPWSTSLQATRVLLLWGFCATAAWADQPPQAGSVADSLRVVPPRVVLRGPDSVQQLAVEVIASDSAARDESAQAKFGSSDPKVAEIDASGMISAKGDGAATITVRWGERTVDVPVTVTEFTAERTVNFANQVVPIFTKLGCNSGGCHGKASGQNGFRLSLLGFEPILDYEALVKEGRGRRLFPARPEQSLLLTKGTATVPHGGGKRLKADSQEYRVISRWIGGGMPVGKATDPTVSGIEIYPDSRVMTRGTSQQMIVTAHYTDGTTEDVTRWAQYQSNDPEVADVAEGGKVATRELSGQAGIMARYQGQVAVFRATVPLGLPIANAPEFRPNNLIDVASLKQWNALGILPSESCTDAEFIRRASLDIIGTLPTADEIKAFVADPSPEKRATLVDRLLDRPEYATYFAIKWADILRNKREGDPTAQHGTFGFYDWIRENLAQNTPYDQFVRAILAASGTPETSPPVQWYRRIKAADAFVDDSAQVFLGMRLQCAKCHHHPFEKWSENDYYGFAAFFARIGRKPSAHAQRIGRNDEVIFTARTGSVTQPKTKQVMAPKGLGGDLVAIAGNEDPRQKLVDWMAAPQNPFFAKALVNRYWAHFFGRGIVEPMDDLRLTNPPSNPDLLDGLADDFVKQGYDLKRLVRTICTSRLYGLSSVPNEYNRKDKQSFARHYPKRLGAEVLLDAISQVSGVPTAFAGLPAGTRAIELPDESVVSAFLDTFGRPKRDTPCECERVGDASLGQSLMLLNSGEVQAKLAAAGGRAEALAKDPRTDEAKVEELFWAAFGRTPSSGETASALAHLTAHADKKREAFEDIVWALINAKEFQFND
ncbi:Ig-like domain (group 2) [Singulisphaera sp. GP187]|uniref:DUF1549 domain-containing protein n=1 Tax=Singulisphaera sp. GP187 TaxID=1882752 RepID=UPI0009272EA0|nr:DUF1549 domain-containing protein [Singulisphaera sp. GP187]SIO59414.1 Ig-like domain (group 2) [Singulisphaera sp. GP187]